ncbi:MAG: type II secretion system GspH family protein [Acidobacteriia bacterium]|nr:type II secretion system GspH family protein [Terriglobia bacterium]
MVISRAHLKNPSPSRPRTRTAAGQGFTLLELLIVVSIIMILATVILPSYRQSITRAREAVLKDDLHNLRSLIDQYTVDKQKAPQSLDDLVTAGYIREIPKDPFTNSSQSWKVDFDNAVTNPGQTESGIIDVHSGANGTSIDGTAYISW